MPSADSPSLATDELLEEGACRRRLRLAIPAAEVEAEFAAAARRLAREVRVPGFRRGRAPTAVLRARHGDALNEDVVEALARRHLGRVLERRGTVPVVRPVLESADRDADGTLKIDLVFEVEADLVLGDYRGLTGVREVRDVAEPEVDEALEALRQGLARVRAVEERGAAPGDEVTLDLEGEHVDGPEAGGRFQRPGLIVQVGGDELHPDLSAALVGGRAGEERRVTIRYPEGYRTPALAGRTIAYLLRLGAVRDRLVPALDDELAREAGPFADLAALRAAVRQDLEGERRARGEQALRDELARQLLERHPLEVPEGLVQHEVRHRLEGMARELASRGVDAATSVDWRAEGERLAGRLRDELRLVRVLDAIAARESIEPPAGSVDAVLEREAAAARRPAATLRAQWEKDGRMAALAGHLRRRSVLDFLIAVGHIQERKG